jgi:hypothetical protein
MIRGARDLTQRFHHARTHDFEGWLMATTPTLNPATGEHPLRLRTQYDNYIGGRWAAPLSGQYFDNVTPVTGEVLYRIARSNAADVEAALDAAHAAKTAWGRTSTTERSRMFPPERGMLRRKLANVFCAGGVFNRRQRCLAGHARWCPVLHQPAAMGVLEAYAVDAGRGAWPRRHVLARRPGRGTVSRAFEGVHRG